MSLRVLSRSFRLPVTRSVIPFTRPFSTSTHSFMDRPKPTSTAVVEPTMSSSSMSLSRDTEEDWEATNSDADTSTTASQPQSRGMSSASMNMNMNMNMNMSMADEQAKEMYEMSAKDDWTEEAEAMAQDIHTSRGMKPPVDTDYM